MADPYPDLPQALGTSCEVLTKTEADFATSGKPRLRTFFSKKWRVFRVVHECTPEQRDEILDHYATTGESSFDFTYQGDGATYEVRYAEAPQRAVRGNYFDWVVETVLFEV